MGENQRRKERIQSQNLLFLCVKDNDDIIQQGMGKTLNVSESGIRLETNFSIDSKKTVILSIGFEDPLQAGQNPGAQRAEFGPPMVNGRPVDGAEDPVRYVGWTRDLKKVATAGSDHVELPRLHARRGAPARARKRLG